MLKFLRRRFGTVIVADFAEDVIASLKARGASAIKLDLPRGEIVATFTDGQSHLYLGNVFGDYQRARYRDRPPVVQRFLAGMFLEDAAKPRSYEIAMPRLLPVVRNSADVGIADLLTQRSSASKPAGAERPRMMRRRFTADLARTGE
jgi:hypothetical protein